MGWMFLRCDQESCKIQIIFLLDLATFFIFLVLLQKFREGMMRTAGYGVE